MADANSEMLAYYASRVSYYDAVYQKPERQRDIAFLKQYLPQRFAGLSLLEIACGTGYWTQFIAPTSSRTLAIDIMPEALEYARRRPGTEHTQFVVADAYALPPGLGRFQAAFVGLWLSHVPLQRRQEFLRSLHRALLPGARVIFLDNSEVQCRELPIAERDSHGNTYQLRPLRDGSVHRVLKNFPTRAELWAMLPKNAEVTEYRLLDNFWLFEYALNSAPGPSSA